MENFIIKDKDELLKKMEMCNTMMGIVIAHDINKKGEGKAKSDLLPNPADAQFLNLKCDLKPMKESSKDYKMAKDYFETGMDRGGWGNKYKILHAYEVERNGEKK